MERHRYYDLVRPCMGFRYSPCRFSTCAFPWHAHASSLVPLKRLSQGLATYAPSAVWATTSLLLPDFVPGELGPSPVSAESLEYRCFTSGSHAQLPDSYLTNILRLLTLSFNTFVFRQKHHRAVCKVCLSSLTVDLPPSL